MYNGRVYGEIDLMKHEIFIARRYLRTGRFFISVSTWITVVGVTLGVAVVCFVMSMHNGFESEIRSRLLGTTSHVTVFPYRDDFISDYLELVDRIEQIDGVKAASPFIFFKAAISSASEGDGIIVRGIDLELEARTASIKSDIIAGEYSFEPTIDNGDTVQGMILGSNLAHRLGVFVGQPVVLYSISGEDIHRRTRPRVAKFFINGLFETGMYEFDGSMAYVSLIAAQHLFKIGDAVTAVHLKLDDIYKAAEVAPIIDSTLEFDYDVVPWNILHKNLFSWISIEKMFMFLGFILIVIVAAFSIVSTLVMHTMEKRAEIGILKTIGFTPGAILRIFLYKGLAIATVGVLTGWGLALFVAELQNRYKLVSLPADIYFISYVPVESHLIDYGLAGATTFVICLLASLYPAYQASKTSVIDVLRQ